MTTCAELIAVLQNFSGSAVVEVIVKTTGGAAMSSICAVTQSDAGGRAEIWVEPLERLSTAETTGPDQD